MRFYSNMIISEFEYLQKVTCTRKLKNYNWPDKMALKKKLYISFSILIYYVHILDDTANRTVFSA